MVVETRDLTTPRPWTGPSTDILIPPVVRRIDEDEQGRRRTRFLAEFLPCADGSLDPHANAILAVEAVNAYDRLCRIEEAARAFLAAAQLESMTKAPEYIAVKRALRAALGDRNG